MQESSARLALTTSSSRILRRTMRTNCRTLKNLSYDDGAFDVVIVHAGLHHCYSPHRGLLEMYRVARKCAVAFEARESLLMRAAVRLNLTETYEHSAILPDGTGGVANTRTPNFIYRWTEREVTKTIASCDPARVPQISFFYDLRIPIPRFTQAGNRIMRAIGLMLEPLSRFFARIAPKQCNEFAFAVSKNGPLHPWIKPPIVVIAGDRRHALTETFGRGGCANHSTHDASRQNRIMTSSLF